MANPIKVTDATPRPPRDYSSSSFFKPVAGAVGASVQRGIEQASAVSEAKPEHADKLSQVRRGPGAAPAA